MNYCASAPQRICADTTISSSTTSSSTILAEEDELLKEKSLVTALGTALQPIRREEKRTAKSCKGAHWEAMLCVLVGCLLIGVGSATCPNGASACDSSAPAVPPTHSQQKTLRFAHTTVDDNNSNSSSADSNSTFAQEAHDLTSSPAQTHSWSRPSLLNILGAGTADSGPAESQQRGAHKDSAPASGGKNISKRQEGNQARLSDTPAESSGQATDGSDNTKIIGIVIPFVCVIIFAILFFVVFKLCRKYKCCDNEKCLKKCAAFCDNCMTTPYVYQVPGQGQDADRVSRISSESVPYSHASGAFPRQQHRGSQMSRNTLNLARQMSHGPHVARHDSSRSATSVLTHPGARTTPGGGRHNAAVRHNSSGRVRPELSRLRHDSVSSAHSHRSTGRPVRHDSRASKTSNDGAHMPMNPKKNQP